MTKLPYVPLFLGTALLASACGAPEEEAASPGNAEPAGDAETGTMADEPQRTGTGDGAPDDAAASAATEDPRDAPEEVSATVIDREGNAVGSLVIHPRRQGVRLDLQVSGLQPGTHAVHFHETGRCETPDFASAGGHYNPAEADHGMPDADEEMNDQDHHAGDMLNQTVDDTGELNVQMFNQTVTLRGENALLDEDGSALVIHADADDYQSQPAGNAGERVACAEIVGNQ
ncbi:MAG: superoxide dismutase family protein [Pseudomonadota bacterium]